MLAIFHIWECHCICIGRKYENKRVILFKIKLFFFSIRDSKRSFLEIIYNGEEKTKIKPANYTEYFIKTKKGNRDVLVVVFPSSKKDLFLEENSRLYWKLVLIKTNA